MTRILLMLFVIASSMTAQSEFARFENFTTQEGLSSSNVTAIVQDLEGFIWIATLDGLNRYSGDNENFLSFTYTGGTGNELSTQSLRALAVDGRGWLWMGEDEGVDLLNPYTLQFSHFRSQDKPQQGRALSNNSITYIGVDKDGNAWIGTRDGLNRFDYSTNSFSNVYRADADNPAAISNNIINVIYNDRKGRLWIGTEDGLNQFDFANKRFVRYGTRDSQVKFISSAIKNIVEDDEGRLWIITFRGISLFNPDKQSVQNARNVYRNLPRNFVPTAYNATAKDGYVWLGDKEGDGLYRINVESKRVYRYTHDDLDQNSLSDDNVTSTFVDKNGLVWIGTDGGVSKLRFAVNQHFLSFKRVQGQGQSTLASNLVRSVYQDRNNDIWVGTLTSGITRFRPNPSRNQQQYFQYMVKRNQTSISGNEVRAFLEDIQDRFWIGTANGLDYMDRLRQRFVNNRVGPGNRNQVNVLAEDGNGQLWIGTDGGVVVARPLRRGRIRTTRTIVSRPNDTTTIASNIINAIKPDGRDRVWIGTDNGLSLYDSRTNGVVNFRNIRGNPNSLSNNKILSIHIDRNGAVWIGTQNGLNKYRVRTRDFQRFTTREGLPNGVIHGIVEDDSRHLWLSTNFGISRFQYEESTFRNYQVSDGLATNEFNNFTYHRSQSGNIFFGSLNGVVYFNPKNLLVNETGPDVVIADFQVNSSTFVADSGINKTPEVELDYDQNSIRIELAAIDFNNPEKNTFRYRLDNLQAEFQSTEVGEPIAFPNLQPGEYTLIAYASNSDGVESANPMQLGIIVSPPLWKMLWFQLLLFGLLIGLVLVIPIIRIRAQKRREEELEYEVYKRTREIQEKSDQLFEVNKVLENENNIRRKTEAELRLARRETDSILANVNDGLFLLDEEFKISTQYSAELKNIFHREELARMDFVALMKPLITSKAQEALNDFVELLFLDDIDEEVVNELNPLDRIEVHFEQEPGKYMTKHLEFSFGRIIENQKISTLLVTVRDISRIIELQKQLEKTEAKNKIEMEQLLSILRVEPLTLKDYIESVRKTLNDISKIFEGETGNYRGILNQVYRQIHTLKGNAGLLELAFFVDKFHEIEDFIDNIKDKVKLTGDDFLPIVVEINEILNYVRNMDGLIQRVMTMSGHLKKSASTSEMFETFKLNLNNIIDRLGERLNKRAALQINQLDQNIPDDIQPAIQNIAVQLVRNSMYHGVEEEDVRVTNNKKPIAQIDLQITRYNGNLIFKYRDDGKGLDIEKIRNRALQQKVYSEDKIKSMSRNEIAKLIFLDGLSTADFPTEDAGRGEGMSIIRELVSKHRGKMRFSFAKGKFFEIGMEFPVN